jgi:putative Mg2+ transporter-C (MgtC) family protein
MEFLSQDYTAMLVSVLCGSMLGIEREYHNKSAGLRTIVLICLGATIFTIMSRRIGGTEDRIAANIITGIGFIGAGVIFKENFNVKGLTTAAVIWISAAIGMVAGINEYKLAFVLSFIVLIILSSFGRLEYLIDFMNHKRTYRIIFTDDNIDNLTLVSEMAGEEKLKSLVRHLSRSDNRLIVQFEISGNRKNFKKLTEKLVIKPGILAVEH